MSARPLEPPRLARGCRCGGGAIPYSEGGESPSCAKCGRALRPAASQLQIGASIGVEERTGGPGPGPRPEPAARPKRRVRAWDAEPPPAPSLAPQAGSGPSFEWPFGACGGKGPSPRRAGGER